MRITPRLRPYAWLALGLSTGGLLYAMSGLVMTASLSAAPNAPTEVIAARARAWESAMVLSTLVGIASIYVLIKSRNRSRSDNESSTEEGMPRS